MASLIQWTPLRREFEPFEMFADTFFNNTGFNNTGFEPRNLATANERSWAPPVDFRETEDGFELHADLPGMTKEDIDLTFEDNVLTLSGERKFADAGTNKGFRRIERLYGKFTRSFQLPAQIDASAIQAAFQAGVLTVTLPKAAEAKPRKVEIA